MEIDMSKPRVYAACLASYSNGILHGRWVDCTQGEQHIRDEIADMLASSPTPGAEEYAFHDYSDWPSSVRLTEYHDISELVRIADAIETHGDVFSAAMDHWCDVSEAIEACENAYQGAYGSVKEWAESYLEECGTFAGWSEFAKQYFNFEQYARDMEIGGDIVESNGHIFFSSW
jgi:antirestriction protein